MGWRVAHLAFVQVYMARGIRGSPGAFREALAGSAGQLLALDEGPTGELSG